MVYKMGEQIKINSFTELVLLSDKTIEDIKNEKDAEKRLDQIKIENHYKKLQKQVRGKGITLENMGKRFESLERKLIAKDEEIERLYAKLAKLSGKRK